MKNKKFLGTTLVVIMIILMGISVAMIASVSFPKGQNEYNNSYYFVTRQLFWLILGSISFFITSRVNYKKYKSISMWLYIIEGILLIAVLVIGKEVNGAKRWLSLGGINIQPSEFAKVVLIIVLASIIDRSKRKKKSKTLMFFNILIPIVIYSILILGERSFSSAAQVTIIGLIMLFISGVNLGAFFGVCIAIGGLGIVSIFNTEYRLKRLLEYMGSSEAVYQEKQSLIAIGSGGLTGRFYGNGLQKYFYLPEIHTDYIFSGYAEETGFIGSIILIILYMLLLLVITITILKLKDRYGQYILTGILIMLSVQIIGNICVVLGVLPSTGITLPILSYGGSTTLAVMTALGITYNIIKALYVEEIKKE